MKRPGVLKNMKELAAALGVTPTFIKRMKYAGFEMPGAVATEGWALKWLREHPAFRQKDYTRPCAKSPSALLQDVARRED